MLPIKPFLPLLCAFFLAANAHAASRYAGQYVGFFYTKGKLDAGVNLTVDTDGFVTGRGTYLDFTEIDLDGSVSDDGELTLEETDGDADPYDYTADFTPNGKKFVARFQGGDVFRGKRVSGSHPEAGIYYLKDDVDEDAVLFINRAGQVYGLIYDSNGNAIELDGTAQADGFSLTADDGVDYEGDFDGDSISGTYDDGSNFSGDFSGSKY